MSDGSKYRLHVVCDDGYERFIECDLFDVNWTAGSLVVLEWHVKPDGQKIKRVILAIFGLARVEVEYLTEDSE